MSAEPRLEALLERDGFLLYKTRAFSMHPLLKEGRDLVTIRTFEGRLKKYDVPLYRRRDGGYLLHRIIGVKDDHYVIRGDNTFVKEHVPDKELVGVLVAFKRKGKDCTVDSRGYRLYAKVWNFIYPVRWLAHKCIRFCGRIKRAIQGRSKG